MKTEEAIPPAVHANQFALLRQRRFLPLFISQFLGAFNDNLFKNALIILVAYQGLSLAGLDAATLVNLAAGVFILPYFLFSATAGQIADKYEKSRLIRYVKLLEIVIMLLAGFGLAYANPLLMFTALFLLGAQATLFGPLKYGILPQHLAETELVGGNGMIESGTFVAILLGTIAGGVLIGIQGGPYWVANCGLVVAIGGWWAARRIPVAVAQDPKLQINWNLFTATWQNIHFARENRTVFLSLMGISWFWFFGATLLSQFPVYSRDVLHGDEHVVTLLLTIFSLGLGLGALLCERLSGDQVEIGLVPFGSIGLTLFALDLGLATAAPETGLQGVGTFLSHAQNWRIVFDLLMLSIFSGFFTVPLYALIQSRSSANYRSRIIAANNILNALFMVVAAGAAIGMLKAGVTIPQIFIVVAVMNAAVALFIYKLVPEFLLRFICWILIHTVYRLRKTGVENIPAEGPALIICNHISYVDALVITAASRRPIRFVMDHKIFKVPVMRFVFHQTRAIPIASGRENPALLQKAFDDVAKALEAGDVVGIFPEGKLTPDGELGPFKPGTLQILGRTPVPVIPMALQGLWGSFFSRIGGRAFSQIRGIFMGIGLNIGTPLSPHGLTMDALRDRVLALRGDRK